MVLGMKIAHHMPDIEVLNYSLEEHYIPRVGLDASQITFLATNKLHLSSSQCKNK